MLPLLSSLSIPTSQDTYIVIAMTLTTLCNLEHSIFLIVKRKNHSFFNNAYTLRRKQLGCPTVWQKMNRKNGRTKVDVKHLYTKTGHGIIAWASLLFIVCQQHNFHMNNNVVVFNTVAWFEKHDDRWRREMSLPLFFCLLVSKEP